MLADFAVENRLRVAGIVSLIVPVAPVAEHVDHDVFFELLAVIESNFRDADGSFGIVAVDMENWRLHHARDIGRIRRRARFIGQRRESDLVIDDQVHGAAGRIAVELREVERLGNNALSSESGIAVDQQRNHLLAFRVAEPVLLGTHNALNHRIDGFQVTGIRRNRHHDFVARRRPAHAARAQVILHVARTQRTGGIAIAFKLRKDARQRLTDHVRQHRQPAAVRHADHHLTHAAIGRAIGQLLQNGDRRFPTLQRKTFLADETGVQEILKLLGCDQVLQNARAQNGVKRPVVGLRLHSLLQPALLLRMLDVHVLASDFSAVGLPQRFQNFAQRGDGLGRAFTDRCAQRASEKFAVEIPDGQTVGERIELSVVTGNAAEGIEIGDQMPADPVSIDQLQYSGFLGDFGGGTAGETRQAGLAVRLPANRIVRQMQVFENFLVKAVFPVKQRL